MTEAELLLRHCATSEGPAAPKLPVAGDPTAAIGMLCSLQEVHCRCYQTCPLVKRSHRLPTHARIARKAMASAAWRRREGAGY